MLDRLTKVFCEVDDFSQAFDAQWRSYLIGRGAAPAWAITRSIG
jgi:hypothetical protein